MTTARLFSILFLWSILQGALAAPRAELWEAWLPHAATATGEVDHRPWGAFLQRRVTTVSDGVNRVDYAAVSTEERQGLALYLETLQAVPVSALTRPQQRAYWINLYNAATVKVILDHYPVDSIRDIDISPGWFADGPWGSKLLEIQGRQVSLDDIEHRILRPIWKDPRLHYALNCASIGCPNLLPRAFTPPDTKQLLEQGAHDYVNHPRGAQVKNGALTVSSIYQWFKSDFGGTDQGVIEHLRHYAEPGLMQQLKAIEEIDDHRYDWSLNDLES